MIGTNGYPLLSFLIMTESTLPHSSPFIMDTGQNFWLGIETLRDSILETLNNFASRMEAATKEAHSALARAADDMA